MTAATRSPPAPRRRRAKQIVVRVALLLAGGVSLYLLLPSLVDVFSSWPELRTLSPLWLAAGIGFEAVSFAALWTLQRIALRTRGWFAVGTSQLAANGAGTVVPGGGAAAGAVQYGMLVRAGVAPADVVSGLTATMTATTAAALALPVVASVAAIVGAAAVPSGLRHVAYLGGGAFVLLAAAATAAFLSDRPVLLAGRAIRRAGGWVGQRRRVADLPQTLLRQRDVVRAAFAAHPVLALLAALGKWGFDFLVLVCVLAALGTRPDSALVLLAYAASVLFAMIPLTPGGLGFVEAGLAGMLVLAGVGGGEAAVATLAYRLVSFWLPLPAGLVAWLLFRRRYGSETASSPS